MSEPEVKAGKQLTKYHVLMLINASPEQWGIVATQVEATSTTAAIRKVVKPEPDSEAMTYVAISSRSFRPVTVMLETKQQLRLA